jgi:hypothetical protein
MKFRRKYAWESKPLHIEPSELVEAIVHQASFDRKGTIESMEVEVRTLTEIVSRMAAKLPEADIVDLADRYGFEPAEGS